MGKKASDYTKSRLTNKFVSLEFETRKRGNYGRLLAYVYLNGQNFNLELVREGWSPYYTKYGTSEKHHTEFIKAENEARSRGYNIWAGKKAFTKTYSAVPVIKTSAPEAGYHGNRKSHKFHKPSCRYYNCKNCTRVFNSRQAAIKAGYIPCKICKP